MTTKSNEKKSDSTDLTSNVTSGISRRGLMGGALGIAGAAGAAKTGLASPRPGATNRNRMRAQGGATLEMWGFDEGRLNFAKAAAALPAFKDKHPDVTINFRQFQFDQMHDKLLAALVSGQGAPDLADVEIARFSQFIKGERVPFQPLTERIGADIDNTYKPASCDPWSWQGEIYGLGNELNAVVFAYRQDVMDAAGIETPFVTWDDTIAAGKKLAESGESKMFGLHDLAFGDWFMMSQAAGTSLFDAEGAYQGDGQLSVDAMTFLHDLVYVDQVAMIAPATAQEKWAGPEYWAAVNANQFVSFFGPPWHLGNLMNNAPDLSGKWVVQKLPSGLGESKATANFGGTGQMITEQSQNADIAWDLIHTANLTVDGALADFQLRTVYPSFIPTYENPALQEVSTYFSDAQIGQIYASVAPELPPFNQSPNFADASLAMERIVITPVMTDKIAPAEALQQLGAEVAKMR